MKDFKKQKVKLGRSLKPATNQTDTGFKTKKINVPTQALKKNIKDLMNKSALSRRELLEIVDCKENQNLIWNSLLHLILGDGSRRKILKSSWKEILEKLDHRPFLALITTHLNCALCHVDKNIRLDALAILENTSLDCAPRGILEKITQNVLEMLDQKTVNARLMVLTQIFKLLELQFRQSDSFQSPWQQSFVGQSPAPSNTCYVNHEAFVNLEVTGIKNTGIKNPHDKYSNNKSRVSEIQEKLLPFLLNYWIESAIVLEKEIVQDSSDLKILCIILKIMGILGKDGSEEDLSRLKSCLQKFKGFPFASDKSRDSAMIKDMNWDFSIVSCEVKTNMKEVVKYLLEFLRESSGEIFELDKIDGMFLVIWEILQNNLRERVNVLENLLKFKVVDRSNVIYEKKFEFLSFVLKEIDENKLDIDLKQSERLTQEIKSWIFSLPRKIWELKVNNVALSRKIIEFLVYVLQKNIINICHDQGLEKFQLSLIPLFHVVSPKGDIFGPFRSYSMECQQLLLNLLFYLPEINHRLLISMVSCLTNGSVNAKTVAHFMDIIYERQLRLEVPLEMHVYASVCTTLLVGYSSKEMNELRNQILLQSNQKYYGLDECLAVKQKLSGSVKKSRQEYINDRVYIFKRIFYAFNPFLDQLLNIIDILTASVLPLDSVLCFCLALSNLDGKNPTNISSMIQSVWNDEDLRVYCT